MLEFFLNNILLCIYICAEATEGRQGELYIYINIYYTFLCIVWYICFMYNTAYVVCVSMHTCIEVAQTQRDKRRKTQYIDKSADFQAEARARAE